MQLLSQPYQLIFTIFLCNVLFLVTSSIHVLTLVNRTWAALACVTLDVLFCCACCARLPLLCSGAACCCLLASLLLGGSASSRSCLVSVALVVSGLLVRATTQQVHYEAAPDDVVGDGTCAFDGVGDNEVFAVTWVVVGFPNEVRSTVMVFRC